MTCQKAQLVHKVKIAKKKKKEVVFKSFFS